MRPWVVGDVDLILAPVRELIGCLGRGTVTALRGLEDRGTSEAGWEPATAVLDRFRNRLLGVLVLPGHPSCEPFASNDLGQAVG